jgi:OOP family OmpA-OmpF porin
MRRHMKVLIGFALLAFCFGCAAQSKQCTKNQAPPCPPIVKKETCIQKADNFLILLDTSETMRGKYLGTCKLGSAKNIIAKMNQSIPADMKLNGALRTFGRGYMLFSIGQTDLIYGMTSYDKAGLSEALARVTLAAGDSPMAKALKKATEDLQGVSGTSAVLLVSDGMPTDKGVLQAAEALKKAYGDKVCIYTIQIGDNYYGEKLLEQISGIGGCGFSINADELAGCAEIASFVKQVFFEKAPPRPAPAKIIINSVLFDFDSNVVKPEASIVLEEVAGTLKQDSSDVVIEGHTCSVGSEDYNMGLSERRASAVKDFLVDQGVDTERLTAKGLGEAEPISDNTSKAGREQNRRVEFEVMQ